MEDTILIKLSTCFEHDRERVFDIEYALYEIVDSGVAEDLLRIVKLVHLRIFLPFLDDVSQVAVFAARTPSATAKAMHKSTPQTAITVSPRSNVDRLFHHVGFLKHENTEEWSK